MMDQGTAWFVIFATSLVALIGGGFAGDIGAVRVRRFCFTYVAFNLVIVALMAYSTLLLGE